MSAPDCLPPPPLQARQALVNLKLLREQQLQRFLAHIASFCYYTEPDDVLSESTSLDWIWNYLESHNDIQMKGSHFLKIAEITYSSDVGQDYGQSHIFQKPACKHDICQWSMV